MMSRRLVLLSLGLALAVGCDGLPSHPKPPVSPSAAPGRASSTPAASILPEIVLTADLSEQPARWELVTSIGFGEGKGQLRYVPGNEGAPLEPTAFAVDPDGSLWIVDPGNDRMARFSPRGRFLAGVSGYSDASRDLVFQGPTLYAVRDYQVGLLDEIRSGRMTRSFHVHEGQTRPYVTQLLASPIGLAAEVATPPSDTGPRGFYQVHTDQAGRLEEIPGIPLGDERWASIDASESQKIEVGLRAPGMTLDQPVRIRILGESPTASSELRGGVGPGEFIVSGHNVVMYVKISASVPGGSDVGGRYLLRVGDSPMLWERLPDPRIVDDAQTRHISIGPGGQLYLMVTDKDGVRIYRRPS